MAHPLTQGLALFYTNLKLWNVRAHARHPALPVERVSKNEVAIMRRVLAEGDQVGLIQLPIGRDVEGQDVVHFQEVRSAARLAGRLATKVLSPRC